MPSKARLFGVVALLAAALPLGGLARAEAPLVWTAHTSGALTTLVYGQIDPAAEPLFLLSCFNGMSIAVLDVHQGIPRVEPGQPLTIEISSAKAQSPVAGEVARNEATGATFGDASDIDVKPVLAVLRDPGPLTIKMGETTATLSDQGRAAAVAEFTENCKLK
jgi:hypothetical protein